MLHKLLHPALIMIMKLQRKQELLILNEHPLVEKNVIYAVNHSCVNDMPIASEVIKRHTYVLAAKQRLRFIDYACFLLNGVVWVDRDDRQSKHKAMEQMERLLKKGRNICMYPEGTWNLTESKPILPLYWGIVGLAGNAKVPIVPLVLEYRENICYAKFGQPLTVKETEDKRERINALEDSFAALKWELWEMFPTVRRADIRQDEWSEEVRRRLAEYPLADYKREQRYVRRRE